MSDASPPLTADLLVSAYIQGLFPMADEDGEVYWYDPDPRAILPLDAVHVPRRLQRTLAQQRYEIRIDHDFREIMRACAEPAPGREQTWISEALIDVYCELHEASLAHSVEVWRDGALVGGVYGVSVRGLFAGESMFSRARDTSKIALVYLTYHLRQCGFSLLDVQFRTDHLERFGVVEIRRSDYKRKLRQALSIPATFATSPLPFP